MATRKLEKSEWRSFLDGISGQLEAKEAEIEVASLQLGEQIETADILLGKMMRSGGKSLEQPQALIVAAQRNDHRGAEGKLPGKVGLEAGVGVRIDAAQNLTGAKAAAKQSGVLIEASAGRDRAASGCGAADEFLAICQSDQNAIGPG